MPYSLDRPISAEDRPMPTRDDLLADLRWKKIPVLDDGFVCLVDAMGDDAAVVQAARVSYGEGTKKVSDDRTLIRYLMRHRHSTPFEMAELKFLVRVPLYIWQQWLRHRTANINQESHRYSVADDAMHDRAARRLALPERVEPPRLRSGDWPDEAGREPARTVAQRRVPGRRPHALRRPARGRRRAGAGS